MAAHPPLINRETLDQHRRRAERAKGDFFLHDEVRLEVEDRLDMVNKSFHDVAVVTGFPDLWKAWLPDATVIEDTDTLALPEGQFDLVIHAMALHWANDPVGQLIQCNRALRPDGLMLAMFLGDETLKELRSSLAEAEISLSNGLSPRILPMGEIRDLGALLQRASFALPVADKVVRKASYATLKRLMHDLRAMGETAALTQSKRTFTPKTLFELTEKVYRDNFSEDGRLIATFDLVCLTGWAPDESQPKPLRPGSARSRLADALGTNELKLPESGRR
ncbi:methyltransferase domain-containing protein [Celeribacter sp.]|uniref:methyltransferase domain-containing protein n=1 Tax=Celeribacter sp. TaxID=1890673 RepID=UPI003A94B873